MYNSQLYPNFCTSEKWGSKNKDHRHLLRKELFNFCESQKLKVLNDFLDLNIRPQIENGTISISHCESLGGFIVSNHFVGLDIEDTSRLTDKLIDRISNKDEISNWNNILYSKNAIWPAKESSFKLFSNYSAECKIKTISEISLAPLTDKKFSAQFKNLNAQGFYFEFTNHIIAICTIEN